MDLSVTPLPTDTVGLLEGLTTTRAIRRYRREPIPETDLRAILFGATRAPSGSNRQPFRFLVLTDSDKAVEAKRLIGEAARALWAEKRRADAYATGSGSDAGSPKSRMAQTMQRYVDEFDHVPVLILPCLQRYREATPFEGASIYPACQNVLLAARALGYGGVLTGFHESVAAQLHELLDIPADVAIAATISLGRPEGGHGPVRRLPLNSFVFGDSWGVSPDWAIDPPGTTHTSAGPPRRPSGNEKT
jgi:nitroreductase